MAVVSPAEVPIVASRIVVRGANSVIGQVACIWLASRLLVFLALIFAYQVVPLNSAATGFGSGAPGWLDWATHWDGEWYLRIVREGYQGQQTAFAPLYPLLIKLGTLVFGADNDVLLGLVITNLAFLAALVAFWHLVKLDFDDSVARRAVILVALCPMSLFFSADYPMAIFLLFAVASIYCARTERWLLAGVLGAAATASRQPGIILLVPLAIEAWHQRTGSWISWRWWLRDYWSLALLPLTVAGITLYLQVTTNDALSSFGAIQAWSHVPDWPWTTYFGAWLALFPRGIIMNTDMLAPLITTTVLIWSIVAGWRVAGGASIVYCLHLCAAAILSGDSRRPAPG